MQIPTYTEIYLMDKLLVFEYQNSGKNNGTAFIKRHNLSNNDYIKTYNLVKHFGGEVGILNISDGGFLVNKDKAEYFILDNGFDNYFENNELNG